jgi:hypothetical protein
LFVGVFVAGSIATVVAQPYYFNEVFKPDPYRKPGEATGLVCHQDESGSSLGPFGEAFQSAGTQITPSLREQFPNLFVYPVSRVGDVVLHFSDPENKEVVVEAAGKKIVIDVEKKSGKDATLR